MSEQPFVVERSTVIPVPPEQIWPLLADFRRWPQWSPWENHDPDLRRDYSGADSGVGAKYAWQGKKAGSGTMEILGADEPRELNIRLLFTKPMKADNRTVFRLDPTESGTEVTWRMSGTHGTLGRAFFSLFKMNDKLGKDFEKGLADLSVAARA